MQTLVLGKDYQPMEIVPWERAMTLLCEGKVEVVQEYEDQFVRTVTVKFNMPSIIRFIDKARSLRRAIKFSRANVWLRDKGRCQYCGNQTRRDIATYDHVTPRAQGGKTTWENIVIACVDCNQRKRDRSPVQAGMRLRTNPVKPKFLPGAGSFTLTYRKDQPLAWKDYMHDVAYWNVMLEE